MWQRLYKYIVRHYEGLTKVCEERPDPGDVIYKQLEKTLRLVHLTQANIQNLGGHVTAHRRVKVKPGMWASHRVKVKPGMWASHRVKVKPGM